MSIRKHQFVPDLSVETCRKDLSSDDVIVGEDPSHRPIHNKTACRLRTTVTSTASLVAVAATLPSNIISKLWCPIVAFQPNKVRRESTISKLQNMRPQDDNLTQLSGDINTVSRRAFLINTAAVASVSACIPLASEASIQSDLDYLKSLGRRQGGEADDDGSRDGSSSEDSDDMSSTSDEGSDSSDEDSDTASRFGQE